MADTESNHGRASGHENRDIRVRPVMWMGLILLLGTVASMVLMDWMFDILNRAEEISQPAPASARAGEAPAAAGQPRFVMFPAQNLQEFRQAESQYLNTYGWVDREEGIARVPVERAMDMLVEGGLPPVPPPPPAGESAP
jgi:hypothetical protein